MKKKVLIIDDSKELMQMLKFRLGLWNYSSIAAFTGASGIEMAKKRKPDVIVLDLILPDIDGFEVCRKLRADLRTRDTPIIVLTAHAQKDTLLTSKGCGADIFMTKPFESDELRRNIDSLVK
jgi:DNA-binding response OmpR family regulator